MPYNGSGTFVRVHDWTTDRDAAVKITAVRHDAEDDGFATGLSAAICRNGESTTTASIPFAAGITVTGAPITLTSGQIAFPATQAASANANTLDDYEEGTFTPTVSFGGASVGLTYTYQAGKYTKVGNLVTFWISILINDNGSSTGNTFVEDLPFVADNPTPAVGFLVNGSLSVGITLSDSFPYECLVEPEEAMIFLSYLDTGQVTNLTQAHIGNSCLIKLSGSYTST
jgi:hypothetical protein